MRKRISTLFALTVMVIIIGCQPSTPVDPMVGAWDISGKPGTIFNKGLAVFDINKYAWIEANIYRYRFTNEFDRPVLHLDGPDQGIYHIVISHPDTLVISDGLNALGVLTKTRTDLTAQDIRRAERELNQIRVRHGKDLGDQLTKNRMYIKRRYQ